MDKKIYRKLYGTLNINILNNISKVNMDVLKILMVLASHYFRVNK